ncbi:MAG: hypothetical protein DWQ01_18285 [Planctomycetota bacterium]|nr:MAG: hypothetical protein DWQ01_18285 [Planctomycetota bacterium]
MLFQLLPRLIRHGWRPNRLCLLLAGLALLPATSSESAGLSLPQEAEAKQGPGRWSWPREWRNTFEAGEEAGQILGLRMLHLGLPADAPPLRSWMKQLQEGGQSSWTLAVVAAAALVPDRVSGRPPLNAEDRNHAVQTVLEELLRGKLDLHREAMHQRVRAWLQGRQVEFILQELLEDRVRHRSMAINLVITAPYSASRSHLASFVLDPRPSVQERERLMERLIAGGGRPGLMELAPLLQPPYLDELLRRLLVLWTPLLQPEDHSTLERIFQQAGGSASRFALQLWAREEKEPQARLRILEYALELEPNLRQAVCQSLVRQGQWEALGQRLLPFLTRADPEDRRLALRFLPFFMPAPELLETYKQRLEPEASFRAQGSWMLSIVRLPLSEARSLAAQWLVEGGWRTGSMALTVSRVLRPFPEIDPVLERLLFLEEAPVSLLFPLAVARAPYSEDARNYLRGALSSQKGMRQEQAIQALGTAGEAADLRLLQEIAFDPQYRPMSRAEAIRALSLRAESAPLLLDLLAEPDLPYAAAEALIEGLSRQPEESLRQAARQAAFSGMGRTDPDELRGLRTARWRALEDQPREGEIPLLAAELSRALAKVEDALPNENRRLEDPRRLMVAYASVSACASALAAALKAFPQVDRPEPWALPSSDALGASWLATSFLAQLWPRAADAWCQQVLAEPTLAPSVRVRWLATRVRIHLDRGRPERSLAALQAAWQDPDALWQSPWDLAFGLAQSEVRGWAFPVDRLVDAHLLAGARRQPGPQGFAGLRSLLQAYASPQQLMDGATLVANWADAENDPEAWALALDLASRAVELAPLEAHPRWLYGQFLRDRGQALEAAACFRAVLRLSPDGHALAKNAEKELQDLGLLPPNSEHDSGPGSRE